jgi:hypothetical protein
MSQRGQNDIVRVIRDKVAVSDLSKVISWLMVPRFEHSTLVPCIEQHNHSAMVALPPLN